MRKRRKMSKRYSRKREGRESRIGSEGRRKGKSGRTKIGKRTEMQTKGWKKGR